MTNPTVFISYSHKDEIWKDRLLPHLKMLQMDDVLDVWDDRRIEGGDDWYAEIDAAMEAASVAVLLISANFLSSEFILNEEVPRLLNRRDEKGVRIFPIIITPCAWDKVKWLASIQVRPTDGRPLSSGDENQINEDLTASAKEISLLLARADQRTEPPQWHPLPPDNVSTAHLPITGEYLFGRQLELELLDGAWADVNTNVLSLVAWGGVGKSALVNHWLANMVKDHYRGAKQVYAWSFYSQGTRETTASADQFINASLRWFGDPQPDEGSPWDKGQRLAHLVRGQRTLLILDGLEPLQNPPGPVSGRLKDQALIALVRELAASNVGLCLITTRQRVTDIEHYAGSTAPLIELEHLSDAAGGQLLCTLGVKGTDAELQQAAHEFDGHGLALNLLGSYLRDVCNGDVRRRDEVRLLEEDTEQGGHARRVMASYEKWLGTGPELAVLRLMGLYDRPAGAKSLAALRAEPAIDGLTNQLFSYEQKKGISGFLGRKKATPLNEEKWKRILVRLRKAHLLAEADPHNPHTLDTHPLVREHFGAQLRGQHPQAWCAANDRLYEHYKNAAKERPGTLAEMMPLFQAVAHGCAAGRHQEALWDVYWQRIKRGNEHYSTKKLGAFGSDLAALSNFFDSPWYHPVDSLREDYKAAILNFAGFRLRALGRLAEAAQPMQVSLDALIAQENWEQAARAAGNLSELHLTRGDVPAAVDVARQSVELADRSGDAFLRMGFRTTLADALHQAGRLDEAAAAFEEAEAMQKERQPTLPLLYSLPGYRYCDLLLSQGQSQEVQERAAQTLEWAMQQRTAPLLTTALDHLSLGHALAGRDFRSLADFGSLDPQAAQHLNQAVDGLRQAGTIHRLPWGLLARAALHRLTGNFERAQRDLSEVMQIATRSGMRLHECDAHLEYVRLYKTLQAQDLRGFQNLGGLEEAREHLSKAKALIDEPGYHRRDGEAEALEERLQPPNEFGV